jgi:nicotinate-nucleotide adenylyltransferase
MPGSGIFGGMFDPIHYGHLRTALELKIKLSLDEIRFVPCANPPHRSASLTDASLRLRMVRAAVADQPGFVVDERELRRPGLSYTVDTLRSLRAEAGSRPLCLILGMDAFLGLPRWHEWERLLDFAHLIVAHRPGWEAPQSGVLGRLVARSRTSRAADLHASSAGKLHIEEVTQLEISSSDLRRSIARGVEPKYLLPDSVREIIADTQCYARDARQDTDD